MNGWSTHCKYGHELTPENTYVHGRGGGQTQRRCRKCKQASARKRMREKRKRVPEYHVWVMMKQRCSNPRNKDFPLYGGRGVTVCDRWDDFAAFLEDMGPRASPDHSIDRVNTNSGYFPENCRWATSKQQGQNTRWTKLSEEAVAQMRTMHANGASYVKLGRQFGVTRAAARQACLGITWG